MIKISFILPCYNVAPYISRCLDSIEQQDLPQDEYEVICVDDCSKDNTVDVIKNYQKQYDNIRLICHKENKTAGGARNTGIDAAQGEYIWFVDPDDAVVQYCLNKIYSRAKDLSLDVLLFALDLTKENGEILLGWERPTINEVLSGQQYILKYCVKKGLYEVASHVSCIYKRNYCISNSICYPEIKSSQDVVFVWKAVLSAQRVSSVSNICYHVYRRPGSTTGSKGKLSPQAIMSASILYPTELLNLVDSFPNIHSSMKETLVNDARMSVNNDSRNVLKMDYKQMKEFYHLLSNYSEQIERLMCLMNRKTVKIFNFHTPIQLWFIMIGGFRCYEYIKK